MVRMLNCLLFHISNAHILTGDHIDIIHTSTMVNILELIEKHMEHLEPLESGIILQAQERYLDLVNLIYIIKDLQERPTILVHI